VRHIVVYASLDDIDREREREREGVSFGLTTRNPGLSLGLLCALACARRGKWGEIFPIAVEWTRGSGLAF